MKNPNDTDQSHFAIVVVDHGGGCSSRNPSQHRELSSGIASQEPNDHRLNGFRSRIRRSPPLLSPIEHASSSDENEIEEECGCEHRHGVEVVRCYSPSIRPVSQVSLAHTLKKLPGRSPIPTLLHVKQKVLVLVVGLIVNLEKRFLAEAIIERGPEGELESYIEAIDQLRACRKYFVAEKGFEDAVWVLGEIDYLLSLAMLKIEDEFTNMLESHRSGTLDVSEYLFEWHMENLTSLESSPRAGSRKSSIDFDEQDNGKDSTYSKPLTPNPPPVLLHKLAHQLVEGGHQEQVLGIIRDTRSASLGTSLRKLGVEKYSKDDVQKMNLNAKKLKASVWMENMPKAVELLGGELRLCDHVLKNSETIRARCFDEAQKNVPMLFSFGYALAGSEKSERSPGNLFVLLDMYEIMRKLQAEMTCSEVGKHAKGLIKHLGQTTYDTLCDFQEGVIKDSGRTKVPDGSIHPLTDYVIEYLQFLSCYRSTLEQIFKEFNDVSDPDSHLASLIEGSLQDLQNNLEKKSKQYKDPALAQIFLMNNIHRFVQFVRRSEVMNLLGDDWVNQHWKIFQEHADTYKEISWRKVVESIDLSKEARASSRTPMASPSRDDPRLNIAKVHHDLPSKARVKEMFKNFKSQFEELYRRQKRWMVPDVQLREELRLKVINLVVHAYQSFYAGCRSLVEGGLHRRKHLKYTPEDVEGMISELFEWKPSAEQKH
ncbi:Exocyst complex component EXO70A1-like protein [Drosera capensis]